MITLPRWLWGSKSWGMAEPASNLMDALQRELRGRYDIERELGRGYMGIVYLAFDRKLDRLVALKLLPPERADPVRRKRFLREARLAARLKHPNIVPIHAVDEAGPFVFFTMDYIEGRTLFDRVWHDGPLPVGEATRILFRVAEALGHAHAMGIVHRDVKPNNILLEAVTDRPVVTDFGIAEALAEAAPRGPETPLEGTPPFISPEQVEGDVADARSDVYALGVTAYYIVTRTLPFRGKTVPEILEQHVTRPAPPLEVVGEHFDTTLRRVVARCLVKDPEARFQDGAELAQALKASAVLRDGDPVELGEMLMSVQQVRRSELGLGLLGVAGLSLAGGGAVNAHWQSVALGTGLVAVALLVPFALVMPTARRLFAAGFTRSDIIHILSLDLERQRRALKLKAGRPAPGVRRAYLTACGGLALWGLGTLLSVFGIREPYRLVLGSMVIGAPTFVIAGLIAWRRNRKRNALAGDRWLKLWKSWAGGSLARLVGAGLPVAPQHVPEPDPRLAEAVPALGSGATLKTEELPLISATLAEQIRQWKARQDAWVQLPADHDAKILAGKAILEDYLRRYEGLGIEVSAMPGPLGEDLRAARRLCDEVGRIFPAQAGGAPQVEGSGA
jgi:predicted Ser/Thr protein kinase